ncbi:hypothetical protein DPEC_G00357760 [Dallia pectoralis]|uniref:Uncharacterized protein n=1 Tax=Dallia pectoralis TaxID=75939 RepID=A0ACC2F018_DALPE|nr:hypothetical protein DPEC_G00357760 [Dallia pectoralis]
MKTEQDKENRTMSSVAEKAIIDTAGVTPRHLLPSETRSRRVFPRYCRATERRPLTNYTAHAFGRPLGRTRC